jgi:hypothetical protein
MKTKIFPADKIEKLQNAFTERFPNLKIEFYSVPHKEFKPSQEKHKISDKKSFLEACGLKEPVVIGVNQSDTVAKTESLLFNSLGLPAQVFRKSGDVWLQTTNTDNWTLKKQNQIAEEMNTI